MVGREFCFGRARTVMAGHALLWPRAHFYRRGTHLYCPAHAFLVAKCVLIVGCAFLWPGAHFYGRARIVIARARIFAAGIDGATDEATGSVVSGPTTALGRTEVVPPDAARWHRPRPFNPGTRLDTRLFFL